MIGVSREQEARTQSAIALAYKGSNERLNLACFRGMNEKAFVPTLTRRGVKERLAPSARTSCNPQMS